MNPLNPPQQTQSSFERATIATDSLRAALPSPLHNPLVAIICGSGLGGLQHVLEKDSKVEVPYEAIPGMPKLSGMRSAPLA